MYINKSITYQIKNIFIYPCEQKKIFSANSFCLWLVAVDIVVSYLLRWQNYQCPFDRKYARNVNVLETIENSRIWPSNDQFLLGATVSSTDLQKRKSHATFGKRHINWYVVRCARFFVAFRIGSKETTTNLNEKEKQFDFTYAV